MKSNCLSREGIEKQKEVTSVKPNKRIVAIYIDNSLLTKAENALISQSNTGIYKYRGFSDLIRHAIQFFKDKKIELSKPFIIRESKEVSFLLKGELLAFYDTLFIGKKREIINRCLASYLLLI